MPVEIRANTRNVKRGLLIEFSVGVLVFVVAASSGWLYLAWFGGPPVHDYNNVDGTSLYPAVLWATGHGFSRPSHDPYPAPGLEAFLLKKEMQWDPGQMSEELSVAPVDDKFILDRIYLIYAVGITWWLFGFSWGALNILAALAYGLAGVLSYGIFRLGTNRVVSLAGTALFLSSPLLLYYLPSMRDFFRAPPILATMLLCGYLASRRTSSRTFLAIAVGLGLTIGLGVGFRQDAIICVPPALVTLALLARGKRPYAMQLRILAVALMGVSFFLLARPALKATRDTGGNNAFYLLQGFSGSSLTWLHVQPGSYLPIQSNSDYIVHAGISAYDDALRRFERDRYNRVIESFMTGMRLEGLLTLPMSPLSGAFCLLAGFSPDPLLNKGLDIWSPEAERSARKMFRELAATFPADVIARWYGATALILRGSMVEDFGAYGMVAPNAALTACLSLHRPLADYLGRWGFWCGVGALLAIGAMDVRLGFAVFCFVLYFCGYTSLSFGWRHAFHLQVVTLWGPAFLLGQAFRILAADGFVRNPSARNRLFTWVKAPWKDTRRVLKRVTMLGILCCLLLGIPLGVARLYQRHTVDRVIDRYEAADLEALEWEARRSDDPTAPADGILYCPKSIPGLACPPPSDYPRWRRFLRPADVPCFGIRTEYLVAEIEVPEGDTFITVKYADGPEIFDYWHPYLRTPEEQGKTFRYFFPVYEYTAEFRAANWPVQLPSFLGLAVHPDARLTNLYRVRNKKDFPLVMGVWLPSDRDNFQWFVGTTSLFTNGSN